MPPTGRLSSDLAEEGRVDGDVFDCSGYCPDAEFGLLEKLAQAVAVDEVNRRRAIAGGFFPGVPWAAFTTLDMRNSCGPPP